MPIPKKAAKRTPKRKTREISFPQTIKGNNPTFELFLKSITERYPDSVAPGLVLAYVPKTQLYYASIVRYRGFNGADRYVLRSANAPSLLGVIEKIMDIWRNMLKAPKSATEAFLGIR